MTINEAHRLVKALVGEDDFHDVEDVLSSYYDLAQTEIATTVCPIRKSCTLKAGKNVLLPDDLYRLIYVSESYERTDRNHITTDGGGDVVIKYFAYPKKLYDDSPETTELEVDKRAQAAIPYYAAAQTVLSDSDMRRYYAFMDMYNSILANVNASDRENSRLRIVKTEEIQ
ncbi:MAG: hypothetical protein IJ408_01710 [Clostridia bacterium]|nr:hypothetical protein [Clostridia bacterium]